MKKLLSVLLSLPLALSALSGEDGRPFKGTPGLVQVELRQADGAWLHVGQADLNQIQGLRKVQFPLGLAEEGRVQLRLTQSDGDKAQLDLVRLSVDGKALKPSGLHQVGLADDLRAKLANEDLDVVSAHGVELEGQWKTGAGKGLATLELAGRLSRWSELSQSPFEWRGSCGAQGAEPFQFKAGQKAERRFRFDDVQPSSGHPAAPVEGFLRSDGKRLTGTLHFSPDNDPAPTDYAELLAFDAQGEAKAYRVSLMDDSYGRTQWAYGGPVAFQHMRHDFDVDLAELPKDAQGGYTLGLRAYGSCAGGTGDAFSSELRVNGLTETATASAGVEVYVTATARMAVNFSNYSTYYYPVTVTLRVLDAGGATVNTQVQTGEFNFNTACNADATLNMVFPVTFSCEGTWVVHADSVATGDTGPDNGGRSLAVTVSGTPCPTAVPTPLPSQEAGWGPVIVPGSAPRGTDQRISFPKPLQSAEGDLFNATGDRVGSFNHNSAGVLLLKTANLAPGLYYARIKARYADGGSETVLRRFVIKP